MSNALSLCDGCHGDLSETTRLDIVTLRSCDAQEMLSSSEITSAPNRLGVARSFDESVVWIDSVEVVARYGVDTLNCDTVLKLAIETMQIYRMEPP
jgi:hypothetical protein